MVFHRILDLKHGLDFYPGPFFCPLLFAHAFLPGPGTTRILLPHLYIFVGKLEAVKFITVPSQT